MIITCICGAKLKIGEDKLTEAGVRIKCPKCGTLHSVKRPAPAAAEPVSEPAMPWFAAASSFAPEAPSAPAPSPKVVQPPPAAAPKAAPAAPQSIPHDPSSMSWFAPASSVAPQARSAPVSAAKAVQPLSASSPKAAAGAPQSRPPVPSSQLVLVAHDSKVVADMIQGVVQQVGLVVEHATDGLEALKKASTLKPRVMIVDVGLTGIYGFELCERLKGDPETRSIKIILLSSVYGLTAYKRSPVTLYGADDYIEKHHIPDKLLPKLMQLLSGLPAAAPELPPVSQPAPDEAVTEPMTFPQRTAAPAPPVPKPAARVPDAKFTVPDASDVIPRVPVTLDTTRKRVAAPVPPPVALPPKAGEQAPSRRPVVPAVTAKKAPLMPEAVPPAMKDESINLDASFFEQEEYEAPVKPPVKTAVDPEEVEKARRFARLVVSDIALYNQETVTEGIAKGTFFELLKEDIAEGRALYEKRVPEAIRATKDYYQEAFDNFIAAKKKQR